MLASKDLKSQTRVLKFFQVKNSKRESYTWDLRLRLQDAEFTTVAFEGLKRWKVWDSEVNKLAFHQLTWGSRLQSMDTWISKWLSNLQERDLQKFQEEIKRQSLFIIGDDKTSRKHYHGKSHFLPEEKFSGGWTLSVKTRPWKHQRRCFFILKSLKSDNLWRRLQESIKASGSLKNSESSLGCRPKEEDRLRTLKVLQSICPW